MTTKNSNNNSGGVLETLEAAARASLAAALEADLQAGKPCGCDCLVQSIGPEADEEAVRRYIGSVLRAASKAGSPEGSGAEALPEAAELVSVDMDEAETEAAAHAPIVIIPEELEAAALHTDEDAGIDIMKMAAIKTSHFYNVNDDGTPRACRLRAEASGEFRRVGLEEAAAKMGATVTETTAKRKVKGLMVEAHVVKTVYTISAEEADEIRFLRHEKKRKEARKAEKKARKRAEEEAAENEKARAEETSPAGLFSECCGAAREEGVFLWVNREAVEALDDCALRNMDGFFTVYGLTYGSRKGSGKYDILFEMVSAGYTWDEMAAALHVTPAKARKIFKAGRSRNGGPGACITRAIARQEKAWTERNKSSAYDPDFFASGERDGMATYNPVEAVEEREAIAQIATSEKKMAEVFRLRAAGYSRRDIAEALHVKPDTIGHILTRGRKAYKFSSCYSRGNADAVSLFN